MLLRTNIMRISEILDQAAQVHEIFFTEVLAVNSVVTKAVELSLKPKFLLRSLKRKNLKSPI